MLEQPKVFVLTRAYNAEKTIRRAVESVLNQSYRNITYVIRDNGSTDSTYSICKQYADCDKRVILLHNDKNNILDPEKDKAVIQMDTGLRYGTVLGENDFFCILDADDEYMPGFFERAVQYAQEKRLDIVAGGSEAIQEETGEKINEHICDQSYYITTRQGFSEHFPQYHWHMRQVWGKLFRRNVLLGEKEYVANFYKKELGDKAGAGLPYGADTICVLYNFQQAKRVGFLAGCQHRYYMQHKSVSHTLVPNRLEADGILYRAALGFLTRKCGGPISDQNRRFLMVTYACALIETVSLICSSNLLPEEKLREYRSIATNPLTQAVYRECVNEYDTGSKARLLRAAVLAGTALGGQDDEDLRAVMQALSPHCGQVVCAETLPLFLEDEGLLQALIQDDPEAMLQNLFSHIEQENGKSNNVVATAIQAWAVDHPLLWQISDGNFLRSYAKIYLMVWREEALPALEEMTGLLLENQVTDGKETFLQLYISLAALEKQAPAFVFGKLQLAWFLLGQGRKEECHIVADELVELGVENKELSALRQALY